MEPKDYKSYIEEIRNWLRNLAEDRTIPIDVKVYNLLWEEIQSIDRELYSTKEVKMTYKERLIIIDFGETLDHEQYIELRGILKQQYPKAEFLFLEKDE